MAEWVDDQDMKKLEVVVQLMGGKLVRKGDKGWSPGGTQAGGRRRPRPQMTPRGVGSGQNGAR